MINKYFSTMEMEGRLERLTSTTIPKSKLPIIFKLKLWFYTLFYHSSFSFSYAVDTLFEPLFWFVDHWAKWLGQIFVAAVILLISIVVAVAHLLGFPIWWYRSPPFTFALIVFGYWILVNLSFNFIQAVRVSPGLPNNAQLLAKTTNVTICKKCISSKPARTHHCSICNRCALCMCHHCPWVNNCIGHFNRRYFYLTMVYIVIGCLFVMLFGLEIAYQQVILDKDVLPFRKFSERKALIDYGDDSPDDSVISNLFQQLTFPLAYVIPGPAVDFNKVSADNLDEESIEDDAEEEKGQLSFGILVSRSELLTMIYFVALLCIGASLALGGLCIWHGKLISQGETSIEYHINKAERQKLGKLFANPYDLGIRRNWEIFFGLDQSNIRFWRHILLPSAHVPTGNGYNWDHLTNFTTLKAQSLLD